MRLVMEYTATDGYTFWVTTSHPFIYDSAEAAIVDLEEIIEKTNSAEDYNTTFVFAGMKLCTTYFYSDGIMELPNILTIDEWFSQSHMGE